MPPPQDPPHGRPHDSPPDPPDQTDPAHGSPLDPPEDPPVDSPHDSGHPNGGSPTGNGSSPSPEQWRGRVFFRGHRMDRIESHKVRIAVTIEWSGKRFEGASVVPDLPLDRLEGAADATLRALEAVLAQVEPSDPSPDDRLAFALQGAKVVGAFAQEYVLVNLNAHASRSALSLTGSAAVEEDMLGAAVMATLQATNRWVQLRLVSGEGGGSEDAGSHR